jgi:glycosyltransferase involved in cell wall biosynthesis
LKVCIVNTFHYRRGGDSTYTFDLADLLESHGDKVVNFAMKHPRNVPSEFEPYFVDCVDYRAVAAARSGIAKLGALARSLYSREARDKFGRLLDATRPDIIHLQNFRRHLTFSIVPQARRRGIPVVMTAHDYDIICPNSLLFAGQRACEACRGRHFYRAALVRCKDGQRAGSLAVALEGYFTRLMGYHRMIDVIVTPSRFARDKMVEFGQDPTRITVIPNFIDASHYRPTQANLGYAVCAGRLSAEKGITVLLDAMRRVPEIKVIVAGDGPSRESLEAGAVKAGLKNAEFIGYVPRERLLELVAAAAFVVMPSLSPENFPYSVLEAFALGKPVVASAVGGIPEMVEDGVTGLVVRPGDAPALAAAMHRLIADPGLAVRLGGAGRRRVETQWDASTHYRSIKGLYEGLVAQAGSTAGPRG